MLSNDDRYEEDVEQVKYLMDWAERKEYKKNERKKKRDDILEVFRSSTKN